MPWYSMFAGLNIFYSSQDNEQDRAERRAMFSPLHSMFIRRQDKGMPTYIPFVIRSRLDLVLTNLHH